MCLGTLIQIEHALKGVRERGKLAVGICAKDGVVLATTEKVSALADRSTFQKVCKVNNQIAMTYSGMSPDFRVLLGKSRKESQIYNQKFRDPMPTLQLTRRTAEVMQEYTQQGGVRPFGVSLLIAGFDESGPKLYQADASGAYFQWKATAIGRKFDSAKQFLERRLFANSEEVEDVDLAVDEAVRCLRQENEEEVRAEDIEVCVITKDEYKTLTENEIQSILSNLS